jgi:hypothetical protein
MEHGPVSEDPPVEAAGTEWSPLEMGREKTGGEHKVRGRTHHGGEHLGCRWPEINTASKQSLDLDFTSKLIYFKLAEGEAGAMGNQVPAQWDQKHACSTYGKKFEFLGILIPHRKAHATRSPRRRRSEYWRMRAQWSSGGAPP